METVMRVISAEVTNFGSYEKLSFNFDEQGLCLIQGATGSGKSTLCDIIPWVLFGTTAKDGNADDVKAWNASEDTIGSLIVNVPGEVDNIHISRIRGKSNDLNYRFIGKNDVYYSIEKHSKQRGKDLNHTQKQINALLGFDSTTYLAGAYFHEFSKTAAFFTSTAKNRRALMEQVQDLSLATKLQLKLSDVKKELKTNIRDLDQEVAIAKDRVTSSKNTVEEAWASIAKLEIKSKSFDTDKLAKIAQLDAASGEWETTQANKIKQLESCYNENTISILEAEILKLEELSNGQYCETCGAPHNHQAKLDIKNNQFQLHLLKEYGIKIKQTKAQINPYNQAMDTELARSNSYADMIEHQKEYLVVLHTKHQEYKNNLDTLQNSHVESKTKLADTELLSEVVDTLRSTQVRDTVSFIEARTNELLSTYFDAEIKVSFETEEADKLEVTIYKDGNMCSYTQLSKGQRQLLKLCFGISIMESVSNKSGIQFNSIFFDEALDGLDDTLKVKCYRLMQHLALRYESVFVVEHNESLKQMFEKSFIVTLDNGRSIINEKKSETD